MQSERMLVPMQNADAIKLRELRFAPDDITLVHDLIAAACECRDIVEVPLAQKLVRVCDLTPTERALYNLSQQSYTTVSINTILPFLPQYKVQALVYLLDVYTNAVNISDTDSLQRHLRKLTTYGARRIGIQDLPLGLTGELPRMAIAYGIKDNVYKVLNYDYVDASVADKASRVYLVDKVTPARVIIKTKLALVIPYKYTKKIDGVVEAIEAREDGTKIVAIDNDYCRLLNRYAIVATLRQRALHYGMHTLLMADGTKVYIQAISIGVRKSTGNIGVTSRLYDIGFNGKSIEAKLDKVKERIQAAMDVVTSEYEPGNSVFTAIGMRDDRMEVAAAEDEQDEDE